MAVAGAPDAPLLNIRDLTVGFAMADGVKDVVHGLDLALVRSGALALVGESGSGKSVAMRSILGLLPSNARVRGSAVFHPPGGPEQDLIALPESRLRRVRGRQVGMVFQNAMEAFNPSVPLGRQLAEALLWHRICDRRTARRRAIEALADVGIPEPERRMRMYPFQLSGGMRQRAMIAMAVIGRPDLIIADEPTTALDVTVQKQILDLLVELRDRGMALLMITHDLGVARYVCDDAVVLRHGGLVEKAPVRQLLSSARDPYSQSLVDSALDLDHDSPQSSDEKAEAATQAPLVRCKDLTKVFSSRGGHVVAVDGVSFDLSAGRSLSVVGESGSGKSTLARMVMHLIEPTSGEVLFDDVPLARLSPRRLRVARRDMQMVFQSPHGSLLRSSTVSENIGEPLRINKIGTPAERRTKAAELLRLVGLEPDHLDLYPRQLSGGQQQRVAIARALALEPRLVVADEPTSALDASVQVQVLDLLCDLQERLGFALLLITHNLAVAQRLADEVMVMRHGRVVEHGPTDQVFRAPEHEYTHGLLDAVLPVRDGLDHGA